MIAKKKIMLIIVGILFIQTILYANAITDSNPSNNILSINITVVETNDVRILFVPIDDNSNFEETYLNASLFFNSTYPSKVTNIRGDLVNATTLIDDQSANGLSQLQQIQRNLEVLGDASNADYTVGIVQKNFMDTYWPPFSDAVGINFGSSPKAVFAEVNTLGTSEHEVLHSLSFCDERDQGTWRKQDIKLNISILNLTIRGRCLNGDFNPNDDFLDSECISQGCPTSILQPIYPFGDLPPDGLNNLMGSGNFDSTRWISHDTYDHLLNISKVGFFKKFIKRILYKGDISFDQDGNVLSVNIGNAYILDEGFITEENLTQSGNFSIQVFNSTINITYNLSFNPLQDFVEVNTTNTTISDKVPFIFILPFSSNLTSIKLSEESTILNELNITQNTPNITITSPTANQIFDKSFTITWNASDLDNDTIQYAVLISSDNGNSYSTLEIDYTNKSLTINSTNFVNSNQYKIKILATDGINTGNDTTEPFTISHQDRNKFLIKNSTGETTAWLSDSGNIFLKGNLEVYSNYQKTPNDELIMNFKGNDVLIIDKENGSMYIDGNIAENQNTFNIKDNIDEWIIKDTNGNVALYVNESGYIFMKGTVNTSRITGYKNSFTIKDNFGNKVTRFDDAGNVVLKGTLEQNSNYQRTSNDEWVIRNNEQDVFILDKVNGSLYIDGTLFENQTTLTPKEGSDDFIVKNEFGNAVGFVNESGSMFLKRTLMQNGNP